MDLHYCFVCLPFLEDDLTAAVLEAEALSVAVDFLGFFLSFLLFAESSGECWAPLFSGLDIIEKSLLQGVFEVEDSSFSDSSEVSDSEEFTSGLGQSLAVSVSLVGVFCTTEVTNTFLLKNCLP